MATGKLDLKDTVAPVAVVQPVVTQAAPPVQAALPVQTGFVSRMPSDWHLESLGGDLVKATSNKTGETFEGTIKEFNQKLKG